MSHFKLITFFILIAYTNGELVWEKLKAASRARCHVALGYSAKKDVLFVYGGMSEQTGRPLKDVNLYDFNSNTWQLLSSSPKITARFNAVFGSNDKYFFVAGGESVDNSRNTKIYYNDLWRFDMEDEATWTELTKSLPTAALKPTERSSAGGGLYDSLFVLCHGYNGDETLSDCYSFDTDKITNVAWQKSFEGTNSYNPSYPHARYDHASTMISPRQILFYGGCLSGRGTGGPCPSDDTWTFDIFSKQWKEVNRCSSPKLSSAMAQLPQINSSKIRVVMWGGNPDNNNILVVDDDYEDEVAVFIEEDDEWIIKKAKAINNRYPEPRKGHAMVTTKHGIAMFGGERLSDGAFLSDLWLLRGSADDADTSLDGRECGRQYFSLIMLHGIFMFIGWAVFMVMGIFVARYFFFLQPLWFKLHVTLQVLGVVFILAGTICGIVSVPSHQHFKFAHSVFGYILFFFMIQQPFNAVLRPQPIEQGINCARGFWEFWHHWSGRISLIASLINISLGLFMAVPPTIVWSLWFAYLGFWCVIFIVAELAKKPLEKNLRKRKKPVSAYDTSNPYRISKSNTNTAF